MRSRRTRQLRNKTYRSKQKPPKGGAVNIGSPDELLDLWDKHLYADIHHDFGNIKDFYNISGKLNDTALNKENTAKDYLFSVWGKTQPFVWKQSLLTSPIRFVVPEETAQTTNAIVPLVGVSNIGIVHDAGTMITNVLGANHIISFGNSIDQAGTPKDPKYKPYIFIPDENTITIELEPFGFNQTKAKDICIKDLDREGSVKVGLRGDTDYDAVAANQTDNFTAPVKPKIFNKTDIASAGFFTSISTAEKIGEDVRYNIGKTLGDTMLVASLMPKIPSIGSDNTRIEIDNTFYPLDPLGVLVPFNNYDYQGEPVPVLSNVMLKTGDILNHTRAVMKGVSSILERQKTNQYNHHYEFIPRSLYEADISKSIEETMFKTIESVNASYETFITSLNGLKDEFTGVVPVKNLRTISGRPFSAKQTFQKGVVVGAILTMIIYLLRSVQEYVVEILTRYANSLPKDTENLAIFSTKANRIRPAGSLYASNVKKTVYSDILNDVFIVSLPTIIGNITFPGITIPYFNIIAQKDIEEDSKEGGTIFGNINFVWMFLVPITALAQDNIVQLLEKSTEGFETRPETASILSDIDAATKKLTELAQKLLQTGGGKRQRGGDADLMTSELLETLLDTSWENLPVLTDGDSIKQYYDFTIELSDEMKHVLYKNFLPNEEDPLDKSNSSFPTITKYWTFWNGTPEIANENVRKDEKIIDFLRRLVRLEHHYNIESNQTIESFKRSVFQDVVILSNLLCELNILRENGVFTASKVIDAPGIPNVTDVSIPTIVTQEFNKFVCQVYISILTGNETEEINTSNPDFGPTYIGSLGYYIVCGNNHASSTSPGASILDIIQGFYGLASLSRPEQQAVEEQARLQAETQFAGIETDVRDVSNKIIELVKKLNRLDEIYLSDPLRQYLLDPTEALKKLESGRNEYGNVGSGIAESVHSLEELSKELNEYETTTDIGLQNKERIETIKQKIFNIIERAKQIEETARTKQTILRNGSKAIQEIINNINAQEEAKRSDQKPSGMEGITDSATASQSYSIPVAQSYSAPASQSYSIPVAQPQRFFPQPNVPVSQPSVPGQEVSMKESKPSRNSGPPIKFGSPAKEVLAPTFRYAFTGQKYAPDQSMSSEVSSQPVFLPSEPSPVIPLPQDKHAHSQWMIEYEKQAKEKLAKEFSEQNAEARRIKSDQSARDAQQRAELLAQLEELNTDTKILARAPDLSDDKESIRYRHEIRLQRQREKESKAPPPEPKAPPPPPESVASQRAVFGYQPSTTYQNNPYRTQVPVRVGGLRGLRGKNPNVRSTSLGIPRTSKHSRLRERAGKGGTYRVRQSAGKSRTWRQRLSLGSLRPSIPSYYGGNSDVQSDVEWGSFYANN